MGPYDHYAGVYPRRNEYIDLIIRDRPECKAYRVWVSKNITDLYGDPDASGVGGDESDRRMLFEVKKGTFYKSKTIKSKKLGGVEVFKGNTRALFWLQDFWTASTPQPLPLGDSMCFLRIQEVRHTTGALTVQGGANDGDPIMGPILVIPPSHTFGMAEPVISVSSLAPVTNAVEGSTPSSLLEFHQATSAPPLAIVFPLTTTNFEIENSDVAESLYYAFDWGDPFKTLGYEDKISFGGANFKQIILASSSTAIPFKITVTI